MNNMLRNQLLAFKYHGEDNYKQYMNEKLANILIDLFNEKLKRLRKIGFNFNDDGRLFVPAIPQCPYNILVSECGDGLLGYMNKLFEINGTTSKCVDNNLVAHIGKQKIAVSTLFQYFNYQLDFDSVYNSKPSDIFLTINPYDFIRCSDNYEDEYGNRAVNFSSCFGTDGCYCGSPYSLINTPNCIMIVKGNENKFDGRRWMHLLQDQKKNVVGYVLMRMYGKVMNVDEVRGLNRFINRMIGNRFIYSSNLLLNTNNQDDGCNGQYDIRHYKRDEYIYFDPIVYSYVTDYWKKHYMSSADSLSIEIGHPYGIHGVKLNLRDKESFYTVLQDFADPTDDDDECDDNDNDNYLGDCEYCGRDINEGDDHVHDIHDNYYCSDCADNVLVELHGQWYLNDDDLVCIAYYVGSNGYVGSYRKLKEDCEFNEFVSEWLYRVDVTTCSMCGQDVPPQAILDYLSMEHDCVNEEEDGNNEIEESIECVDTEQPTSSVASEIPRVTNITVDDIAIALRGFQVSRQGSDQAMDINLQLFESFVEYIGTLRYSYSDNDILNRFMKHKLESTMQTITETLGVTVPVTTNLPAPLISSTNGGVIRYANSYSYTSQVVSPVYKHPRDRAEAMLNKCSTYEKTIPWQDVASVINSKTVKVLDFYEKFASDMGYKTSRHKDDFVSAEHIIDGIRPVIITAHVDTVRTDQDKRNISIYGNKHMMFASPPCVLGGDDRAGVYAIHELSRTMIDRSVIFILFNYEESGGGSFGMRGVSHGSSMWYGVANELHKSPKFIIGLDRRGHNNFVNYGYANDKITAICEKLGYKTSEGTYSDVSNLADDTGVACINIAVGFNGEHTSSEWLDLHSLAEVIDTIPKIMDALKDDQYLATRSKYDDFDDYGYGSRWGITNYDSVGTYVGGKYYTREETALVGMLRSILDNGWCEDAFGSAVTLADVSDAFEEFGIIPRTSNRYERPTPDTETDEIVDRWNRNHNEKELDDNLLVNKADSRWVVDSGLIKCTLCGEVHDKCKCVDIGQIHPEII